MWHGFLHLAIESSARQADSRTCRKRSATLPHASSSLSQDSSAMPFFRLPSPSRLSDPARAHHAYGARSNSSPQGELSLSDEKHAVGKRKSTFFAVATFDVTYAFSAKRRLARAHTSPATLLRGNSLHDVVAPARKDWQRERLFLEAVLSFLPMPMQKHSPVLSCLDLRARDQQRCW